MDDVASELRAAVASPPPTRIDVDLLIAIDRRRRRWQVWATAGGALATVATMLIGAGVFADRGPAPGSGMSAPLPTVPVSPGTSAEPLCAAVTPSRSGPTAPLQSYGTERTRPDETPEEAVPRLTAALRDALRAQLPAGIAFEPAQAGCADPQFQYDRSRREYLAGATLRSGDSSGLFLIRIMPTPAGEKPDGILAPNEEGWGAEQFADGVMAMTNTLASDAFRQLTVMVFRADGTTVHLMANNQTQQLGSGARAVTAPQPLLDLAQLARLGQAPGLTLYP